jgi:hypothetical protein
MTDPVPGSGTGAHRAPTSSPVEFGDDGQFRHVGYWNSFQFDPPLTHEDALVLLRRAEELGYRMLFRRADYSQEDIQARLVNEGPSAFLDLSWLQEDISPKEPPATAEQRMAERMRKLAPAVDLIITDPFLFTRSRVKDSGVYAASLGSMMAPALVEGLQITAVVKPSENDPIVRAAVEADLRAREPGLKLSVVESDDFHDRFWIADRARGLVVGTSLNKIGRRIFFVDELSDTDVTAVLSEIDQILARPI